jgi:hypothetical protein
MTTTLAILVLAAAPLFSQVPGFRGLDLGMRQSDVYRLAAAGNWKYDDLVESRISSGDTSDTSLDRWGLLLYNDGSFGCGRIGGRKYCPGPAYIRAGFYKGALYSITIVSEGFADSTGGDSLRIYCRNAAGELAKIYGHPAPGGKLDRLANPAWSRGLRPYERATLAEWRLAAGGGKGKNRPGGAAEARIRIELQRSDEDLRDQQGEPGHRMSSIVVITIIDPAVARAREEAGVRDF